MAIEYVKIASGHNQAASLARFSYVDPWCPRIIPGLQRISMSLKATEDGKRSVDLFFTPKVPNHVKAAALASCGLTSVLYANVTVRLPSNKNRETFSNFNGVAFYDELDEFERRGSGFRILIYDLTAI